MRSTAWLPCTLALLASACAQGTSRPVVAPALPAYAAEVQALAAEALDQLGPQCPRERVDPGCSAVQLMMDYYGDLRARIRASEMKRSRDLLQRQVDAGDKTAFRTASLALLDHPLGRGKIRGAGLCFGDLPPFMIARFDPQKGGNVLPARLK